VFNLTDDHTGSEETLPITINVFGGAAQIRIKPLNLLSGIGWQQLAVRWQVVL
jgi:hypothetical protein